MILCDCCRCSSPAAETWRLGDRWLCDDCEAVCGRDNQASPCRIAAAEEDTCER